ncbi:MAG: hypothetical protein ACXV8K_16945, partial [Ilumatobacteraceae bacterium]
LAVVAAAAIATAALDPAAAVPAEALVAPLAAPVAMNPVRTAAVATPATPAARRARRAGCGRRRRVGRWGAGTGALWIGLSLSVFIVVFLSARSLGLSR